MLAAKDLLESILEEDVLETHEDFNDDYDFGKVLDLIKDDEPSNREVMCADGIKRDILYKK